jgi:hypothetical protein
MAEANLVRKGLATNTLDLSELQLAYFFYNTVADPLGNTVGDKTQAIKTNDEINKGINNDSYLQRGGNSMFTTFALASWTGAALESKAPYGDATILVSYTLNNNLAFDNAYHMQNAYWINMNDRNDIKNNIMNYGAVASSYYSDNQGYSNTTYYSHTNAAYYYNGQKWNKPCDYYCRLG